MFYLFNQTYRHNGPIIKLRSLPLYIGEGFMSYRKIIDSSDFKKVLFDFRKKNID